jgi:hypothetical protein
MKHNANSRRGRNRGNGKRHVPLRSQTFESSGPDGKIRGTAQQVLDRYLALGRDASSSGDPITAESFYQHAEHYYRLLHAADGPDGERSRPRPADPNGEAGEEEAIEPVAGEAPDENAGRLSA